MKVLHIISGDLWAGAEVMAYGLIKELTNYKDVELSSLVLNEGKLFKNLKDLPIETKLINEKKVDFASIYKESKKWFAKNPHDIIHSHRYKENILAHLISRNAKHIKLVATQHGLPYAEQAGRKSNVKHRIAMEVNNRLLTRKFEKFIVVSNDMKRFYRENFAFAEDVLEVIHNGISLPKVLDTNRRKKQFVIGSTGRLFPVKDYPLFVRTAHEIAKVCNDITFFLAGDGPQKVMIQQLVSQYGLQDSFKIIGFVDDTTSFYHNIDIYLNTSLSEGIPMSVLEAMAHGVPVIAANVGGMQEIISTEEEGVLINTRYPKDYADKCLMLFQNESLRRLIGSKGREKVRNVFAVEKMAKRYYSVYKELLC